MGDNPNDWLPTGWRMELRLRKLGRKDKYYYAPSGQKFYSKLEVLRHLKKNLPTDIPQLEERKNGCVGSTQSKENKEVSLHRIAIHACNDSGSCSPTSVEKGKASPDISTYFSCNSMDSASLASGEENQVIEQNVEIHNGDTPNISCLLPDDGKTDIVASAMAISGEGSKHENEENGILYPYTENNCTQNLREDSTLKEAPIVDHNHSSLGETGRVQQSNSPITSQKRNFRHQKIARAKVVLEKCVAEGLPEGWIKEMKVSKKNGNVRRDPYYTDPISGYVFRSMKDVLRYLKTGDIGRLAFKPKYKSSSDVDVELEDEETPSSLTKKQKLAETYSSYNKEGMEDLPEKVVVASTSFPMGELSVPDCAQHERCSSKLSETVQLEHSEERNDFSQKDIYFVPEGKVISEEVLQKQQLRGERHECRACPLEITQFEPAPEEGKSKNGKPSPQNFTQSKDMPAVRLPSVEESKEVTPTSNVKEKATRKPRKIKQISMPRRTSSRLAGIAVDPTREIPSRASRRNSNHNGQEEPSIVKSEIRSAEVLGVRVDPYCITNDRETPDGNSVATRDVGNRNMENKMSEKCVLPFELPLPEILQDPCIEFAIKTLTGMIDFDNLDHAFLASNGMNPKSKDCPRANSEPENHGNHKQGVGAHMFPMKPSLPEPTVKPITEEIAASLPSSSSLGGSWSDPCIEFAIKTLTGAIPLDYGAGVQDIFRQEIRSSQTPGSNEPGLTGVGADSFCRTDSLWQQNNATADNPMYMGRNGLMPSAAPPTHLGKVDQSKSGVRR